MIAADYFRESVVVFQTFCYLGLDLDGIRRALEEGEPFSPVAPGPCSGYYKDAPKVKLDPDLILKYHEECEADDPANAIYYAMVRAYQHQVPDHGRFLTRDESGFEHPLSKELVGLAFCEYEHLMNKCPEVVENYYRKVWGGEFEINAEHSAVAMATAAMAETLKLPPNHEFTLEILKRTAQDILSDVFKSCGI